MQFEEQEISGVFLIKPFQHHDSRGAFVKTFRADVFREHGLESEFRESFYSSSGKGVVRGMHFQMPPYDHAKLVFCISGSVVDVVLDLRKASRTFGRYLEINLSAEDKTEIYIPHGCAHGFMALTDMATLFYMTTSEHHPESDTGIRYDSFGYTWPNKISDVSPRDSSFVPFSNFSSPF